MNLAPATYRGQPLVAMLMLLGGWVAMRAIVWDAAAEPSNEPPILLAGGGAQGKHAKRGPAMSAILPSAPSAMLDPAPLGPPSGAGPAAPLSSAMPAPAMARPAMPPFAPRTIIMPGPAPVQTPRLDRVAVASGHNLLWMAAMSRMPLLLGPMAGAQAAGQPVDLPPAGATVIDPVPQSRPIRLASRWSADAWLMLREGGKSGFTGTTGRPSYGASQAGAVLRYRLAPGSPIRPVGYLQAATALNGVRDRELAAGLSVRPMSRVPVSVAAELRARDEPGGIRTRPAVIAITEIPYVTLPLGTRLETYAQAGYVGGRGHTAFVDGQIRIDHAVKAVGRAELRAGAGLWGGAQKGAARLDIGPAASVGFPLNERTYARVAVDWRLRVAGDAEPASGPALTLSAGF